MKKRKIGKRFLAGLFVMILLVTSVPGTAFAEGLGAAGSNTAAQDEKDSGNAEAPEGNGEQAADESQVPPAGAEKNDDTNKPAAQVKETREGQDCTMDLEQLGLSIANVQWTDLDDKPHDVKANADGTYDLTGSVLERIKSMSMHLNFEILKNYDSRTIREGDYFKVELPSAFVLEEKTTPQPIKFGGTTIANYTIEGNVIKVVFTQELNSENGATDIKGGCGLQFDLDSSGFDTGHNNSLPLDLQGEPDGPNFLFPPKSNTVNGIKKKGTYNSQNGKVTWTIDVGTDTPGLDISGVEIVDSFGGTEVQSIESVKMAGAEVLYDDYGDEIGFKVPNGTKAPASFTVVTQVAPEIFASKEEGNPLVGNTARLEPGDSPLEIGDKSEAEHKVSVPKVTITKEGKQKDSNTMHWTMTVNGTGATIFNPVVTDDLTFAGEIDLGTLRVDGSSIDSSNVDYSQPNLTIYLGDNIDKPVKIEYDTILSPGDLTDTLENQAYLDGTLFSENGTYISPDTGVIGSGLNAAYIEKFDPDFDAKTGILTWKIKPSTRTDNYTSAVITDTIQSDQTYVGNVVIKDKDSNTLDENIDYSLDYNTVSQLLTITLGGTSSSSPDINGWTITYETKAVNYFKENQTYHTYNNSASLDVDDNGVTYRDDDSASYEVKNPFLLKSASFAWDPDGVYMHYIIKVNENDAKLGPISIQDDLGQLATDIYSSDGKTKIGEIPANEWTIDTSRTKMSPDNDLLNIGSDSKITAELPEGKAGTHTIDVWLKLKDDAKNKYLGDGNRLKTSNTVTAKARDFKGGESIPYKNTNTSSNDVSNKLVDKKAGTVVRYNPPTNPKPSYIPWTITVNPNGVVFRDENGSEADSVVIRDTFTEGVRVDKDTIKRYGVKKSGSGLIVDTTKEYPITLVLIEAQQDGKTQLNITIPNDGKPCVIMYETPITEEVTKVTNDAELLINGQKRDNSTQTKTLSANDWGFIKYSAAFKLSKKDAVSGTQLSGALFGLYSDEEGKDLIDTRYSDNNGVVTFYGLQLNTTYYYRELVSPTGYVLPEGSIKNNTLEAEKAGVQPAVDVKNERNSAGEIEFTKAFSDGSTGHQAVFELTDAKGDTIKVTGDNGDYTFTRDSTASSEIKNNNADGKVKIKKLPWGTYTLREIKGADGYAKTPDEFNISISEDGTVSYGGNDSLTIINEPILLSVAKTDMNGNAAAGNPQFTLKGAFADKSSEKILNKDNDFSVDGQLIAGIKYLLKETKAPAGYKLETTEIEITVGDDGSISTASSQDIATVDTNDGRATVSFKDAPIEFGLSKTDLDGNGLDGAEFKLTGTFADAPDTVSEKTLMPSKDIPAVLEGVLIAGNTYSLEEITAPEGYMQIKGIVRFEIGDDGKSKITNSDEVKDYASVSGDGISMNLKNEPSYGDIRFKKTGTDDEIDTSHASALNGAEFTLYKADDPDTVAADRTGKPLQDIESKNGEVVFKDVRNGKYIIKETGTVKNFTLNKSVWNAEINKTGNFTALTDEDGAAVPDNTVVNEAVRGEAYLKKVDSSTKTGLAGVTFKLYEKGGKTPIMEAVSDDQGNVKFTGLLMDKTYVVKETKTLSDYILSGESKEFTLQEQSTSHNLGIIDNKAVELNFIKLTDDDQPLPGATFELSSEDGAFTRKSTSDKDGKVTFVHLEKGKTYKIKEIKAPEDYLLDTNVYKAVVDENGKCTLKNTDGGTIESIPNASSGQIELTKTESGDSSKLLTDAEYTIAFKEKPDKIIDTKKTDKNGKLVFKELPMGSYVIKESAAPDGYSLSKDVTEVKLSKGANQKLSVSMTNELSTLSFAKYGKYSETCGATPDAANLLAGAKFAVYAESDKEFASPVAESESTDTGAVIFKGLKNGKYLIKEIAAPKGYVTDKTVYSTVIKDGYAEPVKDEKGKEIKDGQIINDCVRGDFSFVKVDEKDHDKVLPGSKYGLYKKSASAIAEGSEAEEILIATAVTNKDGRITFEGLLLNAQYVVRELEAPDGSLVSASPIEFVFTQSEVQEKAKLELTDTGNGTVGVDKDGNIVWFEPPTVVSVQKTDMSGEKILEGAHLVLKGKDGKTVDRWTSEKKPHVIQGELTAGETYTLEETEAPDGYILADPVTFTVNDKPAEANQDNTQQVVMKDDSTKVSITKIDAETGSLLSGAKLVLKDKKDTVIDQWLTDGTAHTLEGVLKAGETYTLSETEAPAGYEKAEPMTIEVKKDGSVQDVVMKDTPVKKTPEENNKKPEDTKANGAKTGDADAVWTYMAVLLGAGYVILSSARKRKNMK